MRIFTKRALRGWWSGGLGLMALSFVVVVGCSTKTNNAYYRFYHAFTSYFNYYFNAEEAYKAGVKQATRAMQYDYTRPLPFCIAGLPDAALNTGGEMDRVQTKCATLIKAHSITVKPARGKEALTAKEKAFYAQNEFNIYARRAWLLIGKSRLWAGEFAQARQAIDFAMTQFAGLAEGWEAQIWKARIEMLEGQTLDAKDRLASLAVAPNRPKGKFYTYLLESIWADLLVEEEKYAEAIPHGKLALENAPSRLDRARCRLALAQLQEEEKNYPEAFALYKKVAGNAPSYEMSFNALVRSASLAARVQGKGMEKSLRALAKDEKNADYLDQIYYALGEIAFAKKDTVGGLELFKESALRSVSNAKQKGASHLRVAEYYFAKSDYLRAASSYDSALAALPESYPRYVEVAKRAAVLGHLAQAQGVVLREDSLQRVARMPEAERRTFIQNIIAQLREEERLAKLEAEREQMDRNFAMQNEYRQGSGQQNAAGSSSGWYFYNTSTLAFGRTDFRAKWGNRKLEDNWRRKNKMSTGFDANDPNKQDSVKNGADKYSVAYYLADLPLSDSAREFSDNAIRVALADMAESYRTDFGDAPRAIETYDEILRRYPTGDAAAEACFMAYMTADRANLAAQRSKHREMLLSRYGSTPYARILSDPQYMEKVRAEKESNERIAEEIFRAMQEGRRSEAYRAASAAVGGATADEYKVRFALLSALNAGSEAGDTVQVAALRAFAQEYREYPESKYAEEVLMAIVRRDLVGEEMPPLIIGNQEVVTQQTEKKYEVSKGAHNLLLVFNPKENFRELKFQAISFGVDYNVNLNLEVEDYPLNESATLLVISSFESHADAVAFKDAMDEEEPFGEVHPFFIIISPENLDLLKEQKAFLPYVDFYKKNYK
ncbi:MAG: hypothetical protein ACTTKF_07785 [Bacteroides sp.]